jgi:hypothetical protein
MYVSSKFSQDALIVPQRSTVFVSPGGGLVSRTP